MCVLVVQAGVECVCVCSTVCTHMHWMYRRVQQAPCHKTAAHSHTQHTHTHGGTGREARTRTHLLLTGSNTEDVAAPLPPRRNHESILARAALLCACTLVPVLLVFRTQSRAQIYSIGPVERVRFCYNVS